MAWWASPAPSDLSKAGLARALAGAKEASRLWTPTTHRPSPLAALPGSPLDNRSKTQGHSQLLTRSKRRARPAWSPTQRSRTKFPYNGRPSRAASGLPQHAGACRQQALSTASLYSTPRARKDGRKHAAAVACALAMAGQRTRHRGCIDEAAELTISHLDYAPIATGYTPVCSAREAFLLRPGRCLFSNLFNARAVAGMASASAMRESLGDSLAVPSSSIH